MAMTPLKKPFSVPEKRTIDAAYSAIADVVGSSSPRLATLLASSLKQSTKDFENGTIGRIHVVESFVRGCRDEVKIADLHRMHDGDVAAVIVGAGFRDERPDVDLKDVFDLAAATERARNSWRKRQ